MQKIREYFVSFGRVPQMRFITASILLAFGFAIMLGWLLHWSPIAQLAPRTQLLVFNVAFAASLFGGALLWFTDNDAGPSQRPYRFAPDTAGVDLHTILDHVPALIFYIDQKLRLQYINHACDVWLMRPLNEITGRDVSDVLQKEILETILGSPLEQAFAGQETTFECALSHEGTTQYFRGIYLPHKGSNGNVLGLYGIADDITALKLAEDQLTIMAKHDLLTGLANRAQFNEKLKDAIARSSRTNLVMAVLFLDIDYFKLINDELTHAGGDQILVEFARRLKNCVRQTDTAARLAGDQFAIILEGMHAAEEAATVARKIMLVMEPVFKLSQTERKVTASIGIAIRPETQTDTDALLHKADEALYMAKAAGRNTYQLVH